MTDLSIEQEYRSQYVEKFKGLSHLSKFHQLAYRLASAEADVFGFFYDETPVCSCNVCSEVLEQDDGDFCESYSEVEQKIHEVQYLMERAAKRILEIAESMKLDPAQ